MSANIKEIAHRVCEELWSRVDLRVADEIIAPGCVFHVHDPITPALERGPEGAQKAVAIYRRAFPDLKITIEDTIAEGDKVMIRWTSHGTHSGPLMGLAPTYAKVTATGIDVYRIDFGMIREIWVNWDAMGFMQQLGVEPMAQGAQA